MRKYTKEFHVLRVRRVAIPGALTALLVAMLAGPAFAHVTVHADDPKQGATDVRIAFRVPNESDTAETTKVEIALPTDHPLIGVLVEPTPGWTFTTTTGTLPKPVTTDDGTITSAVTRVTWSGGKVPVGGFQDFNIDVGQLPDASALTFRALQTYSDGHVVSWIETAPPGSPEPDHPAPILQLQPAPADTASGSAAAPASGSAQASGPSSTATAASSTSDTTARVLAGLGIGLAVLLGGVALVVALTTRRRSAGPSVPPATPDQRG